MLTIMHGDGIGYKIKVSEPGTGWRGRTYKAPTLAAVHAAVDHYHGQRHEDTICPFCRAEVMVIERGA